MDVGQEPRHSRATPPPVGIDSRHWPPRARHLLETSYTMMAQGLHEPLRRCLGSFAQQLFALADRAHDNAEQQDYFASRQRVLRDRSAFEERFLARLGKAFSDIDAKADGTGPEKATGWASLELLDPVEQELGMAVERLGARGETLHGNALYELGYRFAVLVGSPPLDGEALPLGPHALAKACHQASSELALPAQHQLLLFSNFDQQVIRNLAPLYVGINTQLLADGILQKLRANPIPRLAKQPSRRGAAETDAAAEATEPPHPTGSATAPQGGSIEVLESLRNLLAQRRGDHAAGASLAERVASPDELQTALAALQQHLARVTDQAGRELRSAQRLREELLAQLNAGKPSGAPHTQLSGEQGDTVELVAMLFEQIGQQLKQGGNARALLGNLQLPVLRMAVTDHEFFEQREHPARKLLDRVTEVANDWLDGNDDESDRALAATLEQLVARTQQEPPSAGLYTALLADIEHHLSLLSRKAQAAERRHTEAARGRERLDQARRQAAEVLAERFAQSPPRGLLRTMMDRAWSDVLALTLLRHGEDSDAFKTQLAITDQLLGRLPVDDRQRLRHAVEAGLQQIGMPAEEAALATRRLLDTAAHTAADEARPGSSAQAPADTTANPAPPPAGKAVPDPALAPAPPPAMAIPPDNNLPSATMLAQRLKQHQRPGAQRERGTQPASIDNQTEAAVPVLGPQEASIHNRLRKLPYGSWFEFLDPVSGQLTQRKLAWFSPVSGNVLFVNRRGARSEQMNLQELAHAIAKGRVRELPPQRESLLDRAWLSLTRSLRQNADAPRAAAQESERR
ncbi:MAG: DUF1631 family protein [Xanthomonadaceae bacterium]|nr:DUF1631 family protein [Xanthomonadaceae bacterium]